VFSCNLPTDPPSPSLPPLQVDKRRVVAEEEGREFASSRGLLYLETSACTGAGVAEAFEQVFQRVVANNCT
jgi:hypothetical protein